MKNLFNSVKLTKPQNNVFDLSHDVKLSCNMGQLVPVMCTECIPGDKFTIGCESLVRFQPLVAPVMHRFDVSIHYFFVPNRIVWENWENYITNTPVGSPAALPAFPTVEISDVNANWNPLCDYLGVPPPPVGSPDAEVVSAIPFAAYQKIYNEYYRDQNLITPGTDSLVDGDNTAEPDLLFLRHRAWEHDYFTSCLPFAQKGAAVEIPVQQSFDDVAIYRQNNPPLGPPGLVSWDVDENGVPGGTAGVGSANSPSGIAENALFADTSSLTGADATTINDLRLAFRLQEWLEKAARGGSRYIENILSFFGVRSSDRRLQRPEYITGVKTPVVISEVLNTTGTEDRPQGDMAGHGVTKVSGKYGSYFCEEHGYIIGIMSIMPKTAYQQGIPRHFIKTSDPFQFYWPQFAHIGEQSVLNREIYAYEPAAFGESTFGYNPRYSEYKFENNRVAGDFRETLDFWHAGRIFTAPPSLNGSFITSDPTTRIFAVEDPSVNKVLCHVYNQVRAVRLMPKFGNPTF